MKNAIISSCGSYRYLLSRDFVENPSNPIIFCMLNPSTADASLDDPTIRRCIGFAKTWGCDSLKVINLYAFRSSSPKNLWITNDPVGIENDKYLRELAMQHKNIVCAWGANAKKERIAEVFDLFNSVDANLYCLGTTIKGMPKHPLYIKSDQDLIPYNCLI